MLETISLAISNLLQFNVLLAVVIGSFIGFSVGAIPGIGGTVGIALVIPLMMQFNPSIALTMFIAIYMGGEFGGCVSAILLNVPGTGSAAATVMDGFPMSKQGKSITALSISAVSSFVGGITSPIILLLLLPLLSKFILLFGTPEFFLLGMLGVTCITAVSKKSMLKGLIVGFFGLMLCTIGVSPMDAQQRYTFGSIYLFDGFGFLPALIGLFGVAEMLKLAKGQDSGISKIMKLEGSRLEGIRLTFRNWRTLIRSTLIGLFIGLVPGVGATTATFVSWAQAKRASKTPDEFGNGCPEGVVSTEAANNSVVSAALMPTLLFGIPGSATSAVILGGLLMLGLQPGHVLFQGEGLVLTEMLLLSLMASAVFLLLIGLFVAPYFGKITIVRKEVLIPSIFVLASLGIYIEGNNLFDVFLIVGFGLLGFTMLKADFPLFPLILALILGTMIEENFLRSLALGGGSLLYLLSKPASVIIILIMMLLLLSPLIKKIREKRTVHKKSTGRG